MNPILRQIYKGIAYCYYHPEDITKKKALEKLFMTAWAMGYPKSYFDKPNKDIDISDMTEWEIKYVLDKQ